jgi:hypothetical protein
MKMIIWRYGVKYPVQRQRMGAFENPRMLASNNLLSYPLTGVNGPCEFWINRQMPKSMVISAAPGS